VHPNRVRKNFREKRAEIVRRDNSTAEGRASNRCTEIILSIKLDELMNLLD